MNTVEIRRSSALAQTQLTLTGAVDAAAIEAVRAAIAEALRAGHTPFLDTEHVSSVEPSEFETLLGLVELYGVPIGPLRPLPGYCGPGTGRDTDRGAQGHDRRRVSESRDG